MQLAAAAHGAALGRREKRLAQRTVGFAQAIGHEQFQRLSDDVGGVISEHSQERRVARDNRRRGVDYKQAVGCSFERLSQQGLREQSRAVIATWAILIARLLIHSIYRRFPDDAPEEHRSLNECA
jgi:hypothetical protein